MSNSEIPPESTGSLVHRPGFSWSEFDLGSDFDIATLSVVASLDPTGVNGVVEEVLELFHKSLEPLLVRLEEHRSAGSATGVRFEAHKLLSAAQQLGALRLSRACNAIMNAVRPGYEAPDQTLPPEVDALLIELIGEIIRVQRKLSQLLEK